MTEGWFGEYGGRFVPETLVPALDELGGGRGTRQRPTRPSPPSSTRSGGSTRAGRRR